MPQSHHQRPLRIGLIGCGHVALYAHLPAIEQSPHFKLHALCDRSPSQLQLAGSRHPGATLYDHLPEFLQSGLDAVVITSSAPSHLDNITEVARSGLPILCEKPLVMNRHEGDLLLPVLEQSGTPLYTAFCYRFSPVALKIRQLLANKVIGEPRSLRLIYNWNLKGKYREGPAGEQLLNERRKARMLEGGPLIDCGSHQVDLSLFWLGRDISRFSCHGAWVEDYEAPDHIWLHMDHACGAHVMVEVSFSYHHLSQTPRKEFVYEIIGTEGVIRYDRHASVFYVDHAGGLEPLPFAHEKNFDGMYSEFAHALRTGSSTFLPNARDSLLVSNLISSATREAISNHTISHPEALAG